MRRIQIEARLRGQPESTYNFLENVDLVEEHALLVVVHVTLAQHLDRALGARLSMHAHAHLSKGTCSQHDRSGVRLKTATTEKGSQKILFPASQSAVTYRFRAPCRFGRSRAVSPECVLRSQRRGCLDEVGSG